MRETAADLEVPLGPPAPPLRGEPDVATFAGVKIAAVVSSVLFASCHRRAAPPPQTAPRSPIVASIDAGASRAARASTVAPAVPTVAYDATRLTGALGAIDGIARVGEGLVAATATELLVYDALSAPPVARGPYPYLRPPCRDVPATGFAIDGALVGSDQRDAVLVDAATARVIWRARISPAGTRCSVFGAAATRDVVVVTTAGAVVALDRASGRQLWSGAGVFLPALAAGDRVYLPRAPDLLEVREPATGTVVWTAVGPHAPLAVTAERVVTRGPGGSIEVRSAANGQALASARLDLDENADAVLDGDHVFVATGSFDGVVETSLARVRLSDGAVRWRVAAGRGHGEGRRRYRMSVTPDGLLYTEFDGTLRVVDRDAGTLRWQWGLGSRDAPYIVRGEGRELVAIDARGAVWAFTRPAPGTSGAPLERAEIRGTFQRDEDGTIPAGPALLNSTSVRVISSSGLSGAVDARGLVNVYVSQGSEDGRSRFGPALVSLDGREGPYSVTVPTSEP